MSVCIAFMKEINRRKFLATSDAIVAGQLATRSLLAASPNETVGIGFVGVGGRGTVLLNNLLSIPGFAVPAICDIDPEHWEHVQELVVEAKQPKPVGMAELKEILGSGNGRQDEFRNEAAMSL